MKGLGSVGAEKKQLLNEARKPTFIHQRRTTFWRTKARCFGEGMNTPIGRSSPSRGRAEFKKTWFLCPLMNFFFCLGFMGRGIG